MFKFNIKDTRFTPCSSVSIANFEHVVAGWVSTLVNALLHKFVNLTTRSY